MEGEPENLNEMLEKIKTEGQEISVDEAMKWITDTVLQEQLIIINSLAGAFFKLNKTKPKGLLDFSDKEAIDSVVKKLTFINGKIMALSFILKNSYDLQQNPDKYHIWKATYKGNPLYHIELKKANKELVPNKGPDSFYL